jgi:aspartate/methionine/tyrosine aminotransferase
VHPVVVNVPSFCEIFTTSLLPALDEAIANARCRIRALLLTNPHNPFGECYPQEVLEGCLKFCQKNDIHFISDEVYALTSFSCAELSEPVPFISALSLDARALGCDLSRIHTIWSISKDFGASGFRMVCAMWTT